MPPRPHSRKSWKGSYQYCLRAKIERWVHFSHRMWAGSIGNPPKPMFDIESTTKSGDLKMGAGGIPPYLLQPKVPRKLIFPSTHCVAKPQETCKKWWNRGRSLSQIRSFWITASSRTFWGQHFLLSSGDLGIGCSTLRSGLKGEVGKVSTQSWGFWWKWKLSCWSKFLRRIQWWWPFWIPTSTLHSELLSSSKFYDVMKTHVESCWDKQWRRFSVKIRLEFHEDSK